MTSLTARRAVRKGERSTTLGTRTGAEGLMFGPCRASRHRGGQNSSLGYVERFSKYCSYTRTYFFENAYANILLKTTLYVAEKSLLKNFGLTPDPEPLTSDFRRFAVRLCRRPFYFSLVRDLWGHRWRNCRNFRSLFRR